MGITKILASVGSNNLLEFIVPSVRGTLKAYKCAFVLFYQLETKSKHQLKDN